MGGGGQRQRCHPALGADQWQRRWGHRRSRRAWQHRGAGGRGHQPHPRTVGRRHPGRRRRDRAGWPHPRRWQQCHGDQLWIRRRQHHAGGHAGSWRHGCVHDGRGRAGHAQQRTHQHAYRYQHQPAQCHCARGGLVDHHAERRGHPGDERRAVGGDRVANQRRRRTAPGGFSAGRHDHAAQQRAAHPRAQWSWAVCRRLGYARPGGERARDRPS